MLLPQLRRIRWAVRAALILGVAASVAANILHAQPNIISQTISAWPPLALLLTVELTSRIPMHRPMLAALRVFATITIAGIAAWVSYWHMQGVAMKYGETETSAYLLPLSVDGLIIVASVSLVELAGRIRVIEERRERAATAPPVAPVQFVEPAPLPNTTAPAPVPAFRVASPEPVPAAPRETGIRSPEEFETVPASEPLSQAAGGQVYDGYRTSAAAPVSPAVGPVPSVASAPLMHSAPVSPAIAATTRRPPVYANGSTPPARPGVTRPAVSAPARTVVTAPTTKAADPDTPRQRRPVLETADLAAELRAMHPEWSENELAQELGISATRLRAVRREARDTRAGSRR